MNTNKLIGYIMYAVGIAGLIFGFQLNSWIIIWCGIVGILWGAFFLSLEDESQNKEEEKG